MMEKIKYHQNGIGPEYGSDHRLTDNWNPDKDYGKEYTEVHFRIETQGYSYPDFRFTEENRTLFYEDLAQIFTKLGWNCDMPYFEKGKSYLYIHPQDISGEIMKNEVKIIAEALQKGTRYQLRWVDLYDTVYDITDIEYQKYLESREKDVRTLLFEKCKTKRKTKFFYAIDKCRQVADKIRRKRVGDYRMLRDDTQAVEFVKKIMDEMVTEGLLIREYVKNGIESEFVRSLNLTEIAARKSSRKIIDEA